MGCSGLRRIGIERNERNGWVRAAEKPTIYLQEGRADLTNAEGQHDLLSGGTRASDHCCCHTAYRKFEQLFCWHNLARNNKLLGTSASLLVTSALLVVTRSY